MAAVKKDWFVYMLECANGRLYIGITTDPAARFKQHCLGKGAMFTRLNRPARILAVTVCTDRSEASKLEYAAKQLTVEGKRLLAAAWTAGGAAGSGSLPAKLRA